MSSLTNICDGDFARQLDIFKEAQAKTSTHARGRQALLMIHKHFSTSRKQSRTYPELTGSGRARLVVLGMETGGRWSEEALTFVRLLAKHKASSNPPSLRSAAAGAWTSRWAALLATAAMRSFACSLLMLPASASSNVDGPPPPLGDVLTSHAESEAFPSRLPMPSR